MNTPVINDQGQAIRRVIALFNTATDDELGYGLAWYANAHDWAATVADRAELSVRQVAGILAALSPQTSWPVNQRKVAELVTTGDTFGLSVGRDKAKRILAGQDPLQVLKGDKERAFFDNIVDPVNSEQVTVDRHTFDAAAGMVTSDRTRRQLDRNGEYDRIANIYRNAADMLNVRPHVVQSVVWVVWRNRFAAQFHGNGD